MPSPSAPAAAVGAAAVAVLASPRMTIVTPSSLATTDLYVGGPPGGGRVGVEWGGGLGCVAQKRVVVLQQQTTFHSTYTMQPSIRETRRQHNPNTRKENKPPQTYESTPTKKEAEPTGTGEPHANSYQKPHKPPQVGAAPPSSRLPSNSPQSSSERAGAALLSRCAATRHPRSCEVPHCR